MWARIDRYRVIIVYENGFQIPSCMHPWGRNCSMTYIDFVLSKNGTRPTDPCSLETRVQGPKNILKNKTGVLHGNWAHSFYRQALECSAIPSSPTLFKSELALFSVGNLGYYGFLVPLTWNFILIFLFRIGRHPPKRMLKTLFNFQVTVPNSCPYHILFPWPSNFIPIILLLFTISEHASFLMQVQHF